MSNTTSPTSYEQFSISIRGEADFLLPAERANLKIIVSSTGNEKHSVAKEVVSSARQIETLLRKHGPRSATAEAKQAAAIDFWSRTSLSESSEKPYDHESRKELPTKYKAMVDYEVHFRKFQAISGVIASLSTIPHNDTQPISWILQDGTIKNHRSALRTHAAKNAYQKALGYAQALGYEKVVPVKLQEAQVYTHPSSRKAAALGLLYPSDDVENARKNLAVEEHEGWTEVREAAFEYQPEDIKMSVAVDASFIAQ